MINHIVMVFFGQIMRYCADGLKDKAKRKELAKLVAAKYDLPLISDDAEEALAMAVLDVVSIFLEGK